MENTTVDSINEKLKVHGSNEYNDPYFRVVFSDEQTEKRAGNFNDYQGRIFIRSVREIREVKKYPWINRKWILERWASGRNTFHKDLHTDKNGVYVCVYVFQDINFNYLPPLLKVCEIVIQQLLNPIKITEMKARDIKIEIKRDEDEINLIENELKISSDEAATKDPKSSRESISIGYSKIEKENK